MHGNGTANWDGAALNDGKYGAGENPTEGKPVLNAGCRQRAHTNNAAQEAVSF